MIFLLRKNAYFLVVAFLFNCSGSQEKAPDAPLLTREQYRLLDWDKRAEYLQNFPQRADQPYKMLFLAEGLNDNHTHVIISALEVVPDLKKAEFKKRVTELLKHKDPIVRWKALLATEKSYVTPETFDDVARMCDDHEWLVRETAYRMVRLFSAEKENKKLFFPILLKLNEKNSSVLKEIYRTLIWYEDERTFAYIYKRSFHTKSNAELVTILRELAPLRRNEINIRLRTLSKGKNAVIKEEALSLLRKYY